jgi:hypothetical protein
MGKKLFVFIRGVKLRVPKCVPTRRQKGCGITKCLVQGRSRTSRETHSLSYSDEDNGDSFIENQ